MDRRPLRSSVHGISKAKILDLHYGNTTVICGDVAGPTDRLTECSKPNTGKQIAPINTRVWILEKEYG